MSRLLAKVVQIKIQLKEYLLETIGLIMNGHLKKKITEQDKISVDIDRRTKTIKIKQCRLNKIFFKKKQQKTHEDLPFVMYHCKLLIKKKKTLYLAYSPPYFVNY